MCFQSSVVMASDDQIFYNKAVSGILKNQINRDSGFVSKVYIFVRVQGQPAKIYILQ